MQSSFVIPTVVIGLGGTGKKVVLQLKQRLYDSYGSRKATSAYPEHVGYPIFKFLCLDTDPTDLDKVYTPQEKAGKTAPDPVRLKRTGDADMYHLDINANDWKNYQNSIKVMKHINNWMPGDFFNKYTQAILSNGAGQNRLAGRLAFFHHFYQINSLFTKCFSELSTAIGQISVWQKELNPKINISQGNAQANNGIQVQIFIVASLAGGTGCGIFLDTAMLLKSLFSRNNFSVQLDPKIYPIIVLPSAYNLNLNQQNKTSANAYATLKEIEYISKNVDFRNPLTYPGKDDSFTIQWTDNPTYNYKLTQTPWEYMYLLDKVNMNKAQVDNLSVINMISDMISCNYDNSDLPDRLMQFRSNFASEMQMINYETPVVLKTTDKIMDVSFSKTFSTFGISAYRYDRDKLKRKAAHLLMRKLFDYWKTGMKAPVINEEFEIVDKTFGNKPPELSESYSKRDYKPNGVFNYYILSMLLLSKQQKTLQDALSGNVTGDEIWQDTILGDLSKQVSPIVTNKIDLEQNSNVLSDIINEHQAKIIDGQLIQRLSINTDFIIGNLWISMTKFYCDIVSTHGLILANKIFDALLKQIECYEKLINEYDSYDDIEGWKIRITDAEKIWIPGMRKKAVAWEVERVTNSVRYLIEGQYIKKTKPYLQKIYKNLKEIINAQNNVLDNSQKMYISKSIDNSLQMFTSKGALNDYTQKMESELAAAKSQDPRLVITVNNDNYNDSFLAKKVAEQFGKNDIDDLSQSDLKRISDNFIPRFSQSINDSNINSLGKFFNFLSPIGILNPDGGSIPPHYIEKIYNALLDSCLDELRLFASDIKIVGELLIDKQKNERLEVLAKYSAPYLSPGNITIKKSNDGQPKTIPDIQLIAYKASTNEIENDLRRTSSSVPFDKLERVGMDEDTIMVYQEFGDFPLAYCSQVNSLADQYDNVDVRFKPEVHICKELAERAPDIRCMHFTDQNVICNNLKYAIKGIITHSLIFIPSNGDSEDRYSLTHSSNTTYHRIILDRLVEELKLTSTNKALASRLQSWETKFYGNLDAYFAYWMALKRLWLDIRHELCKVGKSARIHPVMELLEKEMIPELEAEKKISNHSKYAEIFKLWSDIKNFELDNPDGQYSVAFRTESEIFLDRPHDNLFDNRTLGFPMWVLKRQYTFSPQ